MRLANWGVKRKDGGMVNMRKSLPASGTGTPACSRPRRCERMPIISPRHTPADVNVRSTLECGGSTPLWNRSADGRLK
jgi:hypothetical protein